MLSLIRDLSHGQGSVILMETPYSCKEKDSRRLTVYLHLPDSPGVRRNITCINPDQVSLFLHYLYNRGSEMSALNIFPKITEPQSCNLIRT